MVSTLLSRSFSRNQRLCKSHYDTLSLPITATTKEIKSRFYQLSKKHHPDIAQDNGQKFQEINEAYSVLREDKSRRDYDRTLPASRGGLPSSRQSLNQQYSHARSGLSRRRTRPMGTDPSAPFKEHEAYMKGYGNAKFGFGDNPADASEVRNRHFSYTEHQTRHSSFDDKYRQRVAAEAARRQEEEKDNFLARFLGIASVVGVILLVSGGLQSIRAEVRDEYEARRKSREAGEDKSQVVWEEVVLASRKPSGYKFF